MDHLSRLIEQWRELRTRLAEATAQAATSRLAPNQQYQRIVPTRLEIQGVFGNIMSLLRGAFGPVIVTRLKEIGPNDGQAINYSLEQFDGAIAFVEARETELKTKAGVQ